MISFWKILRTFRQFCKKYYPHIFCLAVAVAAFIGYLRFEFKQHSEELNRWKNLLIPFNGMEALIILPILLVVTSLMILSVISINLDSMRCYDELTHLEIRKQYADYLFIQLITRIEHIEKKQLRCKNIISIENFLHAHEDMRKTIDKFRMDTKKLLELSEVELLLPPQIVFADEEIHSSRFAHLSPEENLVMELAAS